MKNNTHLEIPKTPFRFILFALKPYKLWLFGAVLFIFSYNFFSSSVSYAFRKFVDTANLYADGSAEINTVLIWLMAYPILSLTAALFIRATSFMLNYLTVHARTGTAKTLFEYLSLHSLGYFSDRFSGSLSSRVTTISQNISRLINQLIWGVISLFFSLIVTLILIGTSSGKLAITFLIGFIILIPINIVLTRKQAALSELMAKTLAKLRGQIIDVISNISTVQQYARREFEIDRLDEAIKEHREADIKSDNYREKVLLINNVIVMAFIASIIFWAFLIWSRAGMSIGELVMIVTLTSSFTYSLSHVGQNLNNITESYGEIKDGLNEISVPHDIVDQVTAKELVVSKAEIEFENVEFTYENKEGYVIEDLSLKIESGQKVGVVGASGAGKSTFIKLLLRQHDIQSGKIKIDDQDISAVTQESLRRNISIVPQEPVLFHRTIRENIMYGDLKAVEDDMISVAEKSRAHEFIDKLSEGYESLVGERGIKLSVGQRQRIAIARAFLKNAPILILDEATSALDSESEVAIQEALHNLMENKTVIAIAHRLSTLREMDRILVFDDGKIVEDGSHEELVKKKGIYASLWNHQAGGFLKE